MRLRARTPMADSNPVSGPEARRRSSCRSRAIANALFPSRDVFERGIELRGRSKPRNHVAKVDDLGADR